MSSDVVVGIASVLTAIVLGFLQYGNRKNESSTPSWEKGCLVLATTVVLLATVPFALFYFSGTSQDDLRSVSGTIVEIEEQDGGLNPNKGGDWIAFRLAEIEATFEYGSNNPQYAMVRNSLAVGDEVTVWTDSDADDEKPTIWGIDTADGELVSFDELNKNHRDSVAFIAILLVVGMIVLAALWVYYARLRRMDKFFSGETA